MEIGILQQGAYVQADTAGDAMDRICDAARVFCARRDVSPEKAVEMGRALELLAMLEDDEIIPTLEESLQEAGRGIQDSEEKVLYDRDKAVAIQKRIEEWMESAKYSYLSEDQPLNEVTWLAAKGVARVRYLLERIEELKAEGKNEEH